MYWATPECSWHAGTDAFFCQTMQLKGLQQLQWHWKLSNPCATAWHANSWICLGVLRWSMESGWACLFKVGCKAVGASGLPHELGIRLKSITHRAMSARLQKLWRLPLQTWRQLQNELRTTSCESVCRLALQFPSFIPRTKKHLVRFSPVERYFPCDTRTLSLSLYVCIDVYVCMYVYIYMCGQIWGVFDCQNRGQASALKSWMGVLELPLLGFQRIIVFASSVLGVPFSIWGGVFWVVFCLHFLSCFGGFWGCSVKT